MSKDPLSTTEPPHGYDRTAAAIIDAAAHVFADRGSGASMGEVAVAAGVSRATLYRYYPSREALFESLAAHALADAGARLADAGLERAPVAEAIERVVRALIAVGDRYAILVREQVQTDKQEAERLLGAPIRAVFARGVETAELRDDVPVDVLLELFGGVLAAAIKLVGDRRLGLEEAAATTAALFLDGARPH
jgi:AcrR family transcriptional regulator